MCGTNSVIDRISSSGMSIPESCSILLISDEFLRAERCLDISSKSPKNRTYCCGTKCQEKTRLCPACVMQGEIKPGIDLSEFYTSDLETGLCKFHTANGEKARKPKKTRQEKGVFDIIKTRFFETLTMPSSGKGKKKKPIENPNAKRLILTRLKSRADQIATDDGNGVFFSCPVLDGYDVVPEFCRAKAIKPEQCEIHCCEHFKAKDPKGDDDFSEDDFKSITEMGLADFGEEIEEETDLVDIIVEVRKEVEPIAVIPQGNTLEKVCCPKDRRDILASVCEMQSSENSIQLNHCSRYGCESKWRVCPVCVRRGYPPKAKAMGKNDYFSVDSNTGYCEDHVKYGQDFVKGVGPPQKPKKATVSVARKQTESSRKKPLNVSKEDVMPTGQRMLPVDLLTIGKKAVVLLNEGKSKKEIAKLLKAATTSVDRALEIVQLCEDAQKVFSKGNIPAGRMIQLVGLSKDAQIDLANKLDIFKGNKTEIEKMIAAKREEDATSKGTGSKKIPPGSGKTAVATAYAKPRKSTAHVKPPKSADKSSAIDPESAVFNGDSDFIDALANLAMAAIDETELPPGDGEISEVRKLACDKQAELKSYVAELLRDPKLNKIALDFKCLTRSAELLAESKRPD